MRGTIAAHNQEYWSTRKGQFLFRIRTPKGVKINVPAYIDYMRVPIHDHVYWATSDAALADEVMKNEGVNVE